VERQAFEWLRHLHQSGDVAEALSVIHDLGGCGLSPRVIQHHGSEGVLQLGELAAHHVDGCGGAERVAGQDEARRVDA
jgi:hypothetical protein